MQGSGTLRFNRHWRLDVTPKAEAFREHRLCLDRAPIKKLVLMSFLGP